MAQKYMVKGKRKIQTQKDKLHAPGQIWKQDNQFYRSRKQNNSQRVGEG